MIDIALEQVVSLTSATKLLPQRRKGARPNVATLYRWAQQGVRSIRLETIMVGGTRCTSTEALQRFFDAITAACEPAAPPLPAKPRRKQIEAAEKRLAKAGV
jgi:hypothetical protein